MKRICRLDGCGNQTESRHGYCKIHRHVGKGGAFDPSDLPDRPPEDPPQTTIGRLEFPCPACGSIIDAASMIDLPTLRLDSDDDEVDTILCPRCAAAVAAFAQGRATIYLDTEGTRSNG